MEPIVEVKDLVKKFCKGSKADKHIFTAVDHVSFQLYPGESLGIVGESGCGKSTLAKTMIRLTDISEGTVTICGKSVQDANAAKLREIYSDIQMVFQDPINSFDPRKTLGDGIGEALQNRKVPKAEREKQVISLLETCGLTAEFAKRYPFEVSGGQCQRAAIARALAIDPKILICDEATSALDVTVQKQIMELLQKLKEEKHLSFLFICHNLALVQAFCDRTLVMKDGKIVEEGQTEQLIKNPGEEYTKKLIDAAY